jgi:hypothetical protein
MVQGAITERPLNQTDASAARKNFVTATSEAATPLKKSASKGATSNPTGAKLG